MRLTRLELNGFKSFGSQTVLEFPHAISGVVGPNGSGKSNVADSIRWVLGEQSIKSLRGKRGEDMIFAGSSTQSKMSRASVVLVFDNKKREFPLEFDEVQIERRVYRDGVNEYLINKSDVRLRDIIELLAKVGFGSTRHHIIGQGEADRILYASPSERKEMIEDALGLKIFHLKREEAERKLSRTEENIKQIVALQKEIQPHLKFLKSQAEKFQISSALREELKGLLEEYLSKKLATIEEKTDEIHLRKKRPFSELREVEAEILNLRRRIEKEDKKETHDSGRDRELEEKLRKVREDEMNSLRELGKLEGMIAAEERAARASAGEVIAKKEAERMLKVIAEAIDKITSLEMLKSLKHKVLEFLENLSPAKKEEINLEEKKKELALLKEKIDKLALEAKELSRRYEEEISKARTEAEETRKDEKRVYQLELEAGKLKDVLRSIELEEEKIKLLREEFHREIEEAKPHMDARIEKGKAFESGEEMEVLRKKVERTRVKLEEAGGIDPDVIKEFNEVSSRDEFLVKELGDLDESHKKLEEVMDDLEARLELDFKSGISKINSEFQEFFATMFGGGNAALKIIKQDKRRPADLPDEALAEAGSPDEIESGIDINVDLPRKKVRSLDALSGGERALTSIALLFAMSAVNPPPFLVLDETDAALDEANSHRYAKMLENLSKTTQLVLITHNRNTMKCAGILYGVTMGSDGVSKLLSIKFEEAGALVA
ncbi:hypothetical protein A3B18_03990 [Candidatus Giovannonibacteria bacterium RIFCSPLOWO2_01_FULL_46_13]|uniref:RecF/RecN/SMC N-terminal domain-containing protein n=1 Tax=Candidatus Giovannonibacteria bacterium RIFCSPLOWO2_01_FULL_46_13 TaxID=1798352 RepID=A0A1F5X4Y2_9BACT|nr:MAG: hypothetical protein A3E35_00905 [Candidatus Giovannonibacteria bacterium RIFCSPHIGHO2_12_FULL_44_22]OGF82933.1 MAG: hypothetical protein A3B18_03990 [Candidatus Giovannonibacteria bacterium RIFCSPLOWO2_01_FULL_46_13]